LTKRDKELTDSESIAIGMDTAQPTLPYIIVRFEDMSVTKKPDGRIIIDKPTGGISDSSYAMTAVGNQKNWALVREDGFVIETGNQHGNRGFHWEGNLVPGFYSLLTGLPQKNFTKHRVAGRGYKIQFMVVG
jgi:hypothetical protein